LKQEIRKSTKKKKTTPKMGMGGGGNFRTRRCMATGGEHGHVWESECSMVVGGRDSDREYISRRGEGVFGGEGGNRTRARGWLKGWRGR